MRSLDRELAAFPLPMWCFGLQIFRSLDRGLAAFPSPIMTFWSANIQKLYVLRSAL
jgi:hypothetical protein